MSNPLGWTSPSGPRGRPGKHSYGPKVLALVDSTLGSWWRGDRWLISKPLTPEDGGTIVDHSANPLWFFGENWTHIMCKLVCRACGTSCKSWEGGDRKISMRHRGVRNIYPIKSSTPCFINLKSLMVFGRYKFLDFNLKVINWACQNSNRIHVCEGWFFFFFLLSDGSQCEGW